MLGLFKKILSRTETHSAPPPVRSVPAATPVRPLPKPAAPAVARPIAPTPVTPAAPPAPVTPLATSTHVQVALTSIAAGLPEAISHKVPAHPEQFVSIPVSVVLPQLAHGQVVMTAAQLYECAPDYFSALAGHDDVEIALPLGEIVRQLGPELFSRRQQRRLEVPATVLPVFSQEGKMVRVTSPAAASSAPAQRVQPTLATTTTPMPAGAPAAAGKISLSPQALAALNAANAKAAAATSAPTRPVGLAQPKSAAPAPLPRPASIPQSSASLPRTPAPAPKKSNNGQKLSGELAVPLSAVCAGWVDEVRAQLHEIDTTQAQILVPLEQLEPAMKSGKVIFSWNEVAGWMQPPLPIPPTPQVGEMPVELPLKIVAPLFMTYARTGAQKRAAVDESIPDLFADGNGRSNGSLQAQLPATAPVTAPSAAPTPARAVMPHVAAPVPSQARPIAMPISAPAPVEPEVDSVIGPSGTRFSAKEIIARTSSVPGIAGALLAMTDGLLVTSQVPAGVKAETIAAFLPQMFGRMNQYTKELALGPLEQLTLTVESGHWHVIKCPNVYFGVLGQRGEPLPLNLLAQVAAELSSQSK